MTTHMCCLDTRYLQFQLRILLHLPEMMESCNLQWTFLCHFMYRQSKIQPLLNFSDSIIEILLLRFCYCHFSYKFYKRIYELSTSMKYNTTDIFHYWYSFKQNLAMYWYWVYLLRHLSHTTYCSNAIGLQSCSVR